MKILSIETATHQCSVALTIDQQTLDDAVNEPRMHAQRLLPMIDGLLSQASLSIAQLDAIAFGVGPGSFTGLRIAASVTQGLALAYDTPVIAVSTLQALAQQAMRCQQSHSVLAMLDARMDEFYWGTYQWQASSGLMVAQSGDQLSAWDDITELNNPDYRHMLSPEQCYPSAIDIASIAAVKFSQHDVLPVEQAIPVYIRNKVTQ